MGLEIVKKPYIVNKIYDSNNKKDKNRSHKGRYGFPIKLHIVIVNLVVIVKRFSHYDRDAI